MPKLWTLRKTNHTMTLLATLGLTPDKVSALLNNTQTRSARQVKNVEAGSYQMFTHDEVKRMREQRAAGEKVETLANAFGCSKVHVSKIVCGEYYAKAPGPLTGKKQRQTKVTPELRQQIIDAAKAKPKPSMRSLERRFRMDDARIKKILRNDVLGRSLLRKLTNRQVEEIRAFLLAGWKPNAIGRRYRISGKTIERIRDGESYQDVLKLSHCESKRLVATLTQG